METTLDSISTALDTLFAASERELQPNSAKVTRLIRRLAVLPFVEASSVAKSRSRLPSVDGPLRTLSCDDAANYACLTDGISRSPKVRTPSAIERLIASIRKRLAVIQEYLTKSEEVAVGDPTWSREDPGILDLICYDGTKSSTPVTKFRRLLSQRYFALEFVRWERQKYKTSRVEALCQKLEDSNGANGHVEEFCKTIQSASNRRSLVSGVHQGIKLLVTEALFGSIGISAALAFTPTHMIKLKYIELPQLVRGLRSHSCGQIGHLLEHKSTWLQKCQSHYECK